MTATPKQELHAPPQLPSEALASHEDESARAGGSTDEAADEATDATDEAGSDGAPAPKRGKRTSGASRPKGGVQPNNVRKLRQAAMMSKAELARRAGVSPLTIDRVESGCPCRMDTKRKILEALGLSPSAREQVFGPDIDQG